MSSPAQPPVSWPDDVDELFAGDLVVAVGSPTPKAGVVLYSVTPIGLRDRAAGTVSFTTSLGFGRKLERIAADPRVAVCYHTRQYGHSARPGVVLVQGLASVHPADTQADRDRLAQQAAQHLGQIARGRFWDWWLEVYYLDRVRIDVTAQRILWWQTGSLYEPPVVLGATQPEEGPPTQPPPRNATEPRVSMKKVGRSLRKPHRLIGFVQADGMPFVMPVSVPVAVHGGLVLADERSLLPPGGRRAGFLAHAFRPGLVGLSTATHTGWLMVGDQARWTPHTRRSFSAPPNKTLLLLANGAAARWGYRRALKQGRDEVLRHARARP